MDYEAVPITTMREEEEGVVDAVSGGERLVSRLASMGLLPGIKVKVLRNKGGSVILLASETRMALGRDEASKITVKRTETAPGVRKLLVGLAGQPNVGKSTVFNILTGLSQHVGNWPGKTVEKAEGVHLADDVEMHIVDLPGTYSLTAFSEEERVAREFVIHEQPDVIVLVVNAAALERSLYVLAELLLLDPPVVLAVNMMDVAENQGMHVDVEALERALGIPVISIVATKNKGVKELRSLVIAMSEGKLEYNPHMPAVSADHAVIYSGLMELIKGSVPPLCTARWVATKLMEGDSEVGDMLREIVPEALWNEIQGLLIKHEDALRAVVGGRYDWIEEVTRAAISRFKRGQVLMTDRIDHVLTRPLFGIPILLAILAFVFLVTYKLGFPVQDHLERLMSFIAALVEPALSGAPGWVKGVLINGVIGGAGSVLTFLPILLIFFACLSFLEDVGYMARAAFVMDRFMHIVGLHGKSFLPMCLGFGCNVPSIMGARIVESRKARLLTIFLTPFVPCTARLGVLTFVSGAIFGKQASVVAWIVVSVNIVVLGLSGMVISKFFLKGEPTPFIMELPLYHKPDARTIGIVIWSRMVAFVQKAGTVILLVSIVIWVLSNVPGGTIETSILGYVGKAIEPVGRPLGLTWQEMVALVSSLLAKENSIATLGVLYGVGREGLQVVLPRVMGQASAFAFVVVLMLFIPCAATVTVMKQEMGSWRWFLGSLLFMLLVSFLVGVIAFRAALFAGLT
ncbi:MAG TPA: ferrous iron transport protein B [Syntrophorhabdales bacterium]|nr:ferrous iron transport protein B [Syntrophorhabdales bacterium]